MLKRTVQGSRRKAAHLWRLDPGEHYCEPAWCSERLFQAEPFSGDVLDPCAGFGRIPQAARAAGFTAYAGDIVDRGCAGGLGYLGDFFTFNVPSANLVFNPPFTLIHEFVGHALTLATCKVAAIVPTRRLNAMGGWLATTPLYRVWLLTPRPSMPPGSHITVGGKPGGGTVDFCWLVWMQGFDGRPNHAERPALLTLTAKVRRHHTPSSPTGGEQCTDQHTTKDEDNE